MNGVWDPEMVSYGELSLRMFNCVPLYRETLQTIAHLLATSAFF